MNEYSDIFDEPDSWGIVFNPATKFVLGISGNGNDVFTLIKTSINKYLGNNSGSVIDFQLLKDAVDRHCDSVENDVNTLTPIPLYCGLAGTMAGVIVGLSSLLSTGSITALLSSGSSDFGAAATGVNDLLSGVAWAMLASICGIIFTTLSSILFKARKIKGEAGKNSFLAWLQAKLLPELPSDTSDALNRLVKNPADRNGKAAKLLGSLLMFLRSTPYIYEGEEIGMINNERSSIDEFDDISSHNQYTRALEEGYSKEEALHFVNRRSRDNTRSPMCWNSSEYGGFSDGKPWLALNEHASEINVEKQINDPDSVLSFYKKVIALRQKNVDLIVDGSFEALDTCDEVVAYRRANDSEEIICINNMSGEEHEVSIEDTYEVLLSNADVNYKDHKYQLSLWQTIVLKK